MKMKGSSNTIANMKRLRFGRLLRAVTIGLGVLLVSTFVITGCYFFLSASSVFWGRSTKHTILDIDDNEAQNEYNFNFRLDKLPVHEISKVSESKPQTSGFSSRSQRHLLPTEDKQLDGYCNMHNCFDIYRCAFAGKHKLTIYVYPFQKYVIDGRPVNLPMSKEFFEIIATLVNGPYFVSDPRKACILVPSIDLLNIQRVIDSGASLVDIRTILENLPHWGQQGENHLLFTLSSPDSLSNVSKTAIVAMSAFSEDNRRTGFQIPWLFPNPLLNFQHGSSSTSTRDLQGAVSKHFAKYKLISLQSRKVLPKNIRSDKSVLFLDYCSHDVLNYDLRCSGAQEFNYPHVLTKVDFCLVNQLLFPSLWDVMSAGCIPVIISDKTNLPFDELIDWKKNAILVQEAYIEDMLKILAKVSPERRKQLKTEITFTFRQYLQDINASVNSVLTILRQRVFSYAAREKPVWKSLQVSPDRLNRTELPILDPAVANKRLGFTTVILAYERVQSLFEVIERLRAVPSLVKVLVVWNNQVKKPPPAYLWPNISKPIKVIQTDGNRLSNRFFPYDEIQTEAVFSLDDDIIMLTADEVEFGFQTWCEFSDRIVGFPSRTHVWDNSTQRWKYESEWTNQISMVLTGAAFYHKYWHHAYFNELPSEIHQWVDRKRNCEDIAMNFLVAHATRKAPIKVIPRKKFKCPTCSNNEMLSADTGHMVERTECINRFAQVYGYMPLLPVEFRADPVLFKVDSLPKRLKAFNDVGSL